MNIPVNTKLRSLVNLHEYFSANFSASRKKWLYIVHSEFVHVVPVVFGMTIFIECIIISCQIHRLKLRAAKVAANKVLKKACRETSQATFEQSVLKRMRRTLQKDSNSKRKRGE